MLEKPAHLNLCPTHAHRERRSGVSSDQTRAPPYHHHPLARTMRKSQKLTETTPSVVQGMVDSEHAGPPRTPGSEGPSARSSQCVVSHRTLRPLRPWDVHLPNGARQGIGCRKTANVGRASVLPSASEAVSFTCAGHSRTHLGTARRGRCRVWTACCGMYKGDMRKWPRVSCWG